MPDAIQQLVTPDGILFMPFLVGIMGSVTFGVVGSYVTVRRISYVAAAIAHSALAGIGAAVFFQHRFGWAWCTPLTGAFVAAILSALIIGRVTLSSEHQGDSVISAVMVIGMAVGLLFLKKTPGYFAPMSVLFGDILLVSKRDLWIIGGLNAATIACGVLYYRKLLAVCFDEEYARLRGVRADLYYLLLLLLTALTVVAMMQIVGIIMVIALLTLPAMTALLLVRKLWHCMIVSGGLCALFVSAGLAGSYQTDMPSGPMIVMMAGSVFLLAAGAVKIFPVARQG
ncbi:MAG: metal ABC transporter permease [Lentisphaerae bacterium]|jgi:zinc transport system permease protein|nr:metal ABC transporter permease [Lentisphaerota bacterium]MBT4815072.1 metal ABC transporter permease [Lentisphaerota bacterium]MBT5606162.1 metal ABC transporter permease [Lentisphaerota bacterium]MBT7056381.1 metal ABC transporter permease [Lentisphaerota bacterium]MBT7842943.1 metal ABC transporter permease [Lentisphaerota bacterium]